MIPLGRPLDVRTRPGGNSSTVRGASPCPSRNTWRPSGASSMDAARRTDRPRSGRLMKRPCAGRISMRAWWPWASTATRISTPGPSVIPPPSGPTPSSGSASYSRDHRTPSSIWMAVSAIHDGFRARNSTSSTAASRPIPAVPRSSRRDCRTRKALTSRTPPLTRRSARRPTANSNASSTAPPTACATTAWRLIRPSRSTCP